MGLFHPPDHLSDDFDRLSKASEIVTGEQLYKAHRKAWNAAAERRAHQAGIPRWKNLKFWQRRVWEETAAAVNAAGRSS